MWQCFGKVGKIGRAELAARTGKLGDICTKFKNKFLKTVIFGEFVVLFVFTARNFGALTVYIKDTIMKQNLVVRHGKIGETLKYGLLVLCMALISACGGGGGGGAISVATPDNGGESGSPTTIESRISSQLSAMEREIDKLPADERADYKSIIEGLRSDLAAKEMSIDVLTKQLSEIQQQLQELISALPPEESCENEQYYVDGNCKNCPLGMAFDFDRSECVATASSCGAIGQVYADGRCQECRLGTAFSDNECIATEESCENEQHYIDGSCKNCPSGLAFDFDRSECVATASSCGAIEQVLEGDGCRACESGLAFSDNECIATEESCENEQHYIDGSCKNCPPGLAFDFNRSECVATESSCGAIGQVLEDESCRNCASGLEFRNNKCIATESSCENGQVDTDGNCKNCESGLEWKNNECVPTASYCHANNQIFIRGSCQDCASGLEFSDDKCIPTASYCYAQEQVLENNRCRACASGLEFRNNKCIPTASYCHAHGQVLEDERCRACAAGLEFRNNECVPTALITIAVSCDGHLYNPIAGYIYSAYDGPIYTAHDWRSIGGRFYKDDHVYAPGDWSDCTPTASLCEDDEIRFIDGACITCPAGMTPNVDNSQCVATASSCGTVERISVDGRCQDCPAGTAFRNNECVPAALSCVDGQEVVNVDRTACEVCAPGMEANIENNGCIATVSSCGAIGQVYADGNCRECESGTAFRNNECVPVALSCADGHVYAEEIDGCVDCPAGMVANSENTACIATVSPLYNELVAAIKREIAKLPENKRAVYESRLTGLTIGLSQQEVSTSDLSFLLADIQQHILSIIVVCGSSEHVYTDGRCQECPSGTKLINQYGSDTACIPVALSCAEDQVLVGDRCVRADDCPAGQEFGDDGCIATEESCENDQYYIDDSCKNCPPGMEFSFDTSQCIATASSCGAIGQIEANGNCRECELGMEFSNNECAPILAVAKESREFCNANGMRYSSHWGGFCISCSPRNPVLVGNECIATVEACNAVDRILRDGDVLCEECPVDRPRQGNVCSPQTNEISVATCKAQNKILVGDSCKSCSGDMRVRDNQCVVRSEFDTEEYRENPGYEDMKLSYAYERGYFGQGVTVAIMRDPGYAIDHPDLAANYITTSIDGMNNGLRLQRGGRPHTAEVAGLIGATRNGVGMHGIAPEVKMIPLIGGWSRYDLSISPYLRENNIPIVNNGSKGINRSLSARVFNDFVGDSDTIWVWSAGYGGAYAPILYPRLQTLFVAAMMVVPDNNTFRKDTSGGGSQCGKAKNWCVAAPAYKVYTTSFMNSSSLNWDFTYYWGRENSFGYSRYCRGCHTSVYGTAYASGALALLYGALGIESPQMARAILLTTATDLGNPGVDEIYGHGLINMSAAIVMVENLKTAAAEGLSAVSFANLRGELPSGFSHLQDELSAVQVAVKLTNGLYYNVPLSEMLTPGDDAPDVPLGGGATDMLADAESESRRGFFAYGDIDSELGLRYYGGEGGFSYIAEGQHAKTNQRFFAGDFGALGGVSGKVYSGKVGFTRDMNMAGMQIFGDYERAAVGGDGDEGNLIVGVRDAQAESWMAGLSFADIWKYGDKIKLSARQEMGLSGGDLIVRYPHAVGDFHETFIGEGAQEIEVREAFLPLKQKALMLYTAGYAQKLTAKSEWAAALEYNAGNNAKALSLIWQGEF